MSYPDYSPAVFYNSSHNQVLPFLLQNLFSLSVCFPRSSPLAVIAERYIDDAKAHGLSNQQIKKGLSKHKRQEEQAQQYLEGVRQEENVLVDVTQGFNISIVYKALLQQSKSANIYDGRMVLTNARANMDQMHIKFEILTELCDDFKKCENCRYLPCIDRKVMIELRDLFYDIEKHYFNMPR